MTVAAADRTPLRDGLSLVKFSHTVFALPFALIALIVVTRGRPELLLFLWVVLAVVCARTAAMAFNRFADRKIDAENPRTANREVPIGRVSPGAALALALLSGAAFLLCCAQIGNGLIWWGVPVLLWLYGYSYAKRFTAFAHVWLGLALGLAPAGAWAAGAGGVGADIMPALWLGAGVTCWVTGFDILYACQDAVFDARVGLHSIPVALGMRRALLLSRALHFAAAALFVVFGVSADLGWIYGLGVAGCCGLLVTQHVLVRNEDLSKINMAFFTANGALSVLLLVATCLDLYLLS